jgi:hypothetical protein
LLKGEKQVSWCLDEYIQVVNLLLHQFVGLRARILFAALSQLSVVAHPLALTKVKLN